MVKLDAQFVNTATNSLGGVITEVITDTLFVESVSIDFRVGTISAVVQRGQGNFLPNMDPLLIAVKADGSFQSTDNGWVGTIPAFGAFFAQLRATFDQFILASGAVTGTAE